MTKISQCEMSCMSCMFSTTSHPQYTYYQSTKQKYSSDEVC